MSVSSGGSNFEDTIFDRKNSNIKCSPAEIVDKNIPRFTILKK